MGNLGCGRIRNSSYKFSCHQFAREYIEEESSIGLRLGWVWGRLVDPSNFTSHQSVWGHQIADHLCILCWCVYPSYDQQLLPSTLACLECNWKPTLIRHEVLSPSMVAWEGRTEEVDPGKTEYRYEVPTFKGCVEELHVLGRMLLVFLPTLFVDLLPFHNQSDLVFSWGYNCQPKCGQPLQQYVLKGGCLFQWPGFSLDPPSGTFAEDKDSLLSNPSWNNNGFRHGNVAHNSNHWGPGYCISHAGSGPPSSVHVSFRICCRQVWLSAFWVVERDFVSDCWTFRFAGLHVANVLRLCY